MTHENETTTCLVSYYYLLITGHSVRVENIHIFVIEAPQVPYCDCLAATEVYVGT